MITGAKEKAVISAVGLIAGSMLLEGVILIILQIVLRNYMTDFINVATIIIAILFASIIFPYVLMKTIYMVQLPDLGVVYQPILTSSLLVGAMVCVLCVLIYTNFSNITVLIVLQNIFVATGEEFVARGCFFYLLRKLFKKEALTITISALVFVFVFHSNSTLLENLIWRVPITLIISFVYSKTGSIFNSSIVHMIYNVIISV